MSEAFPIFVCLDLNGTLFVRDKKEKNDNTFDFRMKGVKYWYRPGYQDLLKGLDGHARVKLVFHTSIMQKNVIPILTDLLSGMYNILANLRVFDQEFCPLMHDNPRMAPFA